MPGAMNFYRRFYRVDLSGQWQGWSLVFLGMPFERRLDSFLTVALTPDGPRILSAGKEADWVSSVVFSLVRFQDGRAMPHDAVARLIEKRLGRGDFSLRPFSLLSFQGSVDIRENKNTWPIRLPGLPPGGEAALADAFPALTLKAEAAWCRSIVQHLDPAAMRLAISDAVRLWPAVTRHIELAREGRAAFGFQGPSHAARIAEEGVYAPGEQVEVRGTRFPDLLPMPWMAGLEAPYREIAHAGDEGRRNWEQVVSGLPQVAKQALLDRPLRARILEGREIAGLVQRRLGLKGKVSAARLMDSLSKPVLLAAPFRTLEVLRGAPSISLSAGMAARYGIESSQLALAMRFVPARYGSVEDMRDALARILVLEHFFTSCWSVPRRHAGIKHQSIRSRLPIYQVVAIPADWRLRHPEYAVRSMAEMMENGAFRSLFEEEFRREAVEDVHGMAADVAAGRKWAIAQVVAPEIARRLRREWQDLSSGVVSLGRLLSRAYVDRRDAYAEKGSEDWCKAAAAMICDVSDDDILATAFADLAFPRSIKRLRRMVVGLHQVGARRGQEEAASRDTALSWPPLFHGPVSLPGHEAVAFVLSDSEALLEEGDSMDHCVARHASRCVQGWDHILSVRDRDGERLSTVHMRALKNGGSIVLRLIEHRGRANKPAPGSALAFTDALAKSLSAEGHGGLPVNPAAVDPALLGEPPGDRSREIEHDPFGPDAARREGEVEEVFRREGVLEEGGIRLLCDAIQRGPLPNVRIRLAS
jgi:hypothetical protein